MENKILSLEENIRSLKILHFALLLGPILQILILHFAIEKVTFDDLFTPMKSIGLIALSIGLASLALGRIVHSKKIAQVEIPHTKENFMKVRTAYLMYWAFLEAGTLICMIIYFFIYPHSLLMVQAFLLLIVMAFSSYRQA